MVLDFVVLCEVVGKYRDMDGDRISVGGGGAGGGGGGGWRCGVGRKYGAKVAEII